MFDKNIQTYYMPISSKLNEKTDPVFVEATPIDQQYQLFYKKIVNGEQADSGNGSLVLIDKQLHANDEVRVVFTVIYTRLFKYDISVFIILSGGLFTLVVKSIS